MPNRYISETKPLIEFLNRVYETNAKFASDYSDAFFDSFRDIQTPHMTIVKCSDSRVQMESFDRTPQNGVFAIRNIGNQVATCEGSIDFGVRVLKTPILFIIGHSGCGAVQAVLNKQTNISDAIKKELAPMNLESSSVADAIRENVHKQVGFSVDKYRDLIEAKELTVIGAVYDFKNDYGFGKGKIVFTDLNEITSHIEIQKLLAHKVKNICFFKG